MYQTHNYSKHRFYLEPLEGTTPNTSIRGIQPHCVPSEQPLQRRANISFKCSKVMWSYRPPHKNPQNHFFLLNLQTIPSLTSIKDQTRTRQQYIITNVNGHTNTNTNGSRTNGTVMLNTPDIIPDFKQT